MVTSYDNPLPTSAAMASPPASDADTGGLPPRNPTTPRDAATAQSDLLARVVEGAHQTVDRLAESAAPQVQRLQEGVASAGEMLNSSADKVRELGDEWAEELRSTVREHPLMAVATALALGVLIARLAR